MTKEERQVRVEAIARENEETYSALVNAAAAIMDALRVAESLKTPSLVRETLEHGCKSARYHLRERN